MVKRNFHFKITTQIHNNYNLFYKGNHFLLDIKRLAGFLIVQRHKVILR
jgi:hypothetical protein